MNLTKTESRRLIGLLLLVAMALTCGDLWSQRRRPRRPFPRRVPTAPSKPTKPAAKDPKAPEPKKLAVINATIHTGDGAVLRNATLLVSDDKIEKLGPGIHIPEGATVVDAKGRHLCPGLVVYKLGGVGTGRGGRSLKDNLNPFDGRIKYALGVGITTSIEGSTRSNGVIKLTYGDLDNMFVAQNTFVGMQARSLSGRSRKSARKMLDSFLTWRTAYEAYRFKVLAGDKKAKAPKEPKGASTLVKAYKGDAVLWIDQARTQEQIRGALNVLQEADIPAVLTDVVEGWVLASEIGRARCMAIVRPRMDMPKDEDRTDLHGSTLEQAAILAKAGVPVACYPCRCMIGGGGGLGTNGLLGHDFHTPFLAPTIAVRGGLDEEQALASITRIPAKMAGVGHRLGVLKKGMDADFIIMTGEPLHYQSMVDFTYINGKCYYDRMKEPIYRDIPVRKPGPK